MTHRYLWVLTRHEGIHIDDILAHCGSDCNEDYCCLCRANGFCEEHPEGWDEEDGYFPGCAIHLMWDYAVVGGRWDDEMTTAKNEQPFTMPGTLVIAKNAELETNCIRLSDLNVDGMRSVPFDIVNGAANRERDISEIRVHTDDSSYESDRHREQVKAYLATIPNSDAVTVWGVDAHS